MPTGPQGPDGTYLTPPMASAPRFHHRHMARLAACGLTPTEIAEATGFTCGQVSRILASPLFQKEISRLETKADDAATDLRNGLQGLALKAMCNLEEDLHIADDKDPNDLTTWQRNLRQRASFDILDRAGIGKKEIHVGDLHIHKHDEQHIHEMSVEVLRNEVLDLLKS